MKQFRLLLTILTLLAVGNMNIWAETLTISGESSGHNAPWSTSYGRGTGTSTTSAGSTIGITYTQTARMSTAIQIKAGVANGFYSTTFPANSVITSIAITSKTNSVTLYVSKDGKSWGAGTTISKTTTKTYSAADGYLYFKVNATSKYAQITSITVTYETGGSTPTYTITYDANGGAVSPASDSYTNTPINLPTPTIEGCYLFDGWYTAKTGGTKVQSPYTPTANITLYAHWTAQSNKLSTPTNLKTTDITSNSAKLSWDAVLHASSYTISYMEEKNNTPNDIEDITSTTYTLDGLLPNTYYIWSVKAIGDGTTYCDSEGSQTTGDFTTAALPKYTITWSTPTDTSTTQVTPGDKVVLPATDPTSCSSTYTNFVGWFTEAAGSESNPSTAKPATQVTAATIPTGDTTYYAVFSDATGDGTTTVFSETFDNANGTGGNDNQWSGSNIASTDWNVTQCDNTSGWTVSNVNFANACIKVGSARKKGSVRTPSITISGNATITFLAGAWDGTDEETTLNISATNGKLSQTSVTMKKGEWTSYTITLSDVTAGTTRLTFAAADATKNRFFLDEIKVVVSSTTPATGYISFCTPYIKGTDNITVTSAKGIWVEAVTPLAISAKNLDNNDDHASVTITAESLSPAFTLKGLGTTGPSSTSITLQTGYTQATLDSALTVVYKPTAHNMEEDGQIVLRVSRADALATTYANETITVRGRSLPAEFVLAAKTANGSWVALPADLGTSSTSNLKSPYPIEVDETNNIANGVPETAIYSPANRSSVNVATTGIRFTDNKGGHLQGSTGNGITNVWLSQQNWEKQQSWELRSTDLKDYSIRMQESEQGRYLSYNADQGKIGNYKNGSKLRILPIHSTCVRFDAPELNVQGLASTSVTLRWTVIAGATGYEYSTDGEKTWTACAGITTTATDVEWTLSGLTPDQSYTLYIRAKVADGKTNCSVSGTTTFTTPTCNDVPTNLRASVTANGVTITWNCTAVTATVKIYSDAQGTTEVATQANVSSPCKITGLEQNTDYYYQVLASGSCASAIAHFKTESNEVSIVEWKKDAVIVDINTEVTDADEVSILVEGQKTHGTNNNVADDLFFSKYYEATGNVKLVAIYNGTKDTLPLTNVQIKIGEGNKWGAPIIMSEYGKYKSAHIAPDEEIILWCKGNTSNDKEISDCVAGKMDIKIMNEESKIIFGGPASVGLFRADTLIDMIGAGTKIQPEKGKTKPSWGDDPGWSGKGYDIENPSTEIELSTNRCLLVRGNKVKSGRNAVLNNTTTFATFTKDEWLGRQVTKGDDNGVTESCNGFTYVADFNYNDYYTTYDSITNLEIKGNRNEDGTYTIPILKLDTMACTNLRLQLKKKGTIQATREEKVPIIVNQNTNTEDPAFFGGKLTDEICKTCDVVVRDNAQLLHTAGGKQKFRDMYVYTGSSLNIPENQTMSLDKVRMFATNDSVSYAVINNSNDAAAAISVKEVSHIKRIDGHYWYPFSLPYDCNIADIDQLSGQTLGVYGEDWGIKFYDGKRRQSDGNSTTHYGEVSKYWTMMPEDSVLKAYTGYIIGLFYPDENLMRSVNFPPANLSAYTEDATAKTTPITNWPDNLTAQPRHHGWNFVGSPYISLFGSNNTKDEGLYNTKVQMGYTDALGNQKDEGNIYVSIPDGGNTNTYTQALASGVTIRPFSAYFVQAIDPTNGQSNTLDLIYSKNQRTLSTLAPARTAKTDALILTELDITNGALGDNTGVLVSNVYSAEYEIGDDLTKMYAVAQKPQLYTIDAHNDKMAYQALPDVLAHAIPLGIYVPQAGDYTLSLNRYVSRLEAAEAVYLLHNGAVVANLLLSDYTVSASAKGTISGYSLDIRRAPEVVTDIVPAAGDAPYIIARDGVLAIANLPADAVVQVYDVLGHQLLRADTPATATLQVPVPQIGVYTVVITTANGQQVLKTLLR